MQLQNTRKVAKTIAEKVMANAKIAMALQAGLLDGNPGWEKLEAWLRSSRGQLPMLLVFENTEDVLVNELSARMSYVNY